MNDATRRLYCSPRLSADGTKTTRLKNFVCPATAPQKDRFRGWQREAAPVAAANPHPALSSLSNRLNARLGLPRAARVSKRTLASKFASAAVASSSISLLMLIELDRARAFRRSCLSSGKRIVNVDEGIPVGGAQAQGL
jgi:hypothetical protein